MYNPSKDFNNKNDNKDLLRVSKLNYIKEYINMNK